MTRLRFELEGDGDGFAIKLSAPDEKWEVTPRTLRRGTSAGFPMPPLEEKANWDKKYAELCETTDDTKLRLLHLSILQRDSADGDVDQFGSYLFATLFGPWWDRATKDFPTAPGFDIEILSSADANLDFVPWEMMASGGMPLIAQAQHSVSRIVAPQKKSESGPAQGATNAAKNASGTALKIPLKVLFVVGALDDLLRPGAEYLAFLGNLAARPANGGGGAVNTMLMLRSLVDADAAKLEAAVASFKPNIVHIVAHGMLDNTQPVIGLRNPDANLVAQPDLCSPERLLDLMGRKKRPLPTLVVVNACHTADPASAGDARSFAASLVRGGVAAAVGMAGEVASNACRLFTKALYSALTAKSSLQQAVAESQFAARLHYENQKRSGEWARPSLFIAEGTELTFEEDEETVTRLTAVANVRGRGTIFCDRYSALRSYEDFIESWGSPGGPRILLYEQLMQGPEPEDKVSKANGPEPQNKQLSKLGKSHLLSQLKWRALLDGYLPCHVPSNSAKSPPNNLLLLAIRLAECMDEIRHTLQVKQRGGGEAHRAAFLVLGRPVVSPQAGVDFDVAFDTVMKDLQGKNDIGPNVVAKALRTDIEQFFADVRMKCASMRGVMILLDDLHLYTGYYQHVLSMLNENGLGTPAAPAPVIGTYSAYVGAKGAGVELFRLLNTDAQIAPFAKRTEIKPFPKTAEGELTYSQYMLSQQLAPSRDPQQQSHLRFITQMFHKRVQGAPSLLADTTDILETAREFGALIKADDDAIFKAIHEAQQGAGG